MLKKIDAAANTAQKYIDFLRCPLCAADFGFDALSPYSLRCGGGHNYDISRKGYINLFSGYTKIGEIYDKNLFAARKIISDAGLYDKLCEKLCEIINNINPGAVLDAGCGCGNLTAGIFENTGGKFTLAVDLSKAGIDFAAGNYCGGGLLWLVGNLNNLPVADNKIGVILNIMAPANYAEFIRVLKPGGVLLKVLPEAGYLKELRRFIYKNNDKNEYSNKDVLANLAENINISDITDVDYTHKIQAENITALFDMTPLTSNITDREKIREELIGRYAGGGDGFEVTLAFKIVKGVKK